jgi:hypothetical protein
MIPSSATQRLHKSRIDRLDRWRHRLRKIALFCGAYLAIAATYSLVALLHYQPVSSLPEYTYSSFALEILGHFAFGTIAALPLLDLDFALIGGACAVLIDSDHILDALNLGVSGRPDHSIMFAFVSAALLFLVARKMNFSRLRQIKTIFLGPMIVLAHISYDILYARGPSTFQLFIPFNFQEVTLPYSDWYILLFEAIMVSAVAYLVSRWIAAREEMRMSKARQLN